MQELKIDDPEYQAILLAFVNCVVCNADFNSRIDLRNELNGKFSLISVADPRFPGEGGGVEAGTNLRGGNNNLLLKLHENEKNGPKGSASP